jgi:putative FmdB family regulatory protein
MPIYEIRCAKCGFQGEALVASSRSPLTCPSCSAPGPEKLVAPTSSLTGAARSRMPGPRDHGCCGSRPSQAGCSGPGSCCGRSG